MNAIILDTETNKLHGLPIEIAHVPFSLDNGEPRIFADLAFEQRYSCGQPISYGAMAVHHITESDISGMPMYKLFKLPSDVVYIIGHNIDYDISAISQCAIDTSKFKAICTFALARHAWPFAESHSLSALIYMLMEGSELARQRLRDAHNAKADVILTGFILKSIVRELGIQDLEELYQVSEKARIPVIMPKGKYKGTPIKDLPLDYVAWFLKQSDVDLHLRKALTNSMKRG
ncbi:hypothetical protein F889_01573 [Acinetobacter colistiniresistens]|uniref:Exonuclease domain-containing protein n=1 Tax=Acinetobacter colistiniresistens TaxID=280145 RepID=N9PN68_9GAMM|nr:DUF3820 family protein [Acinetobacter colistiniresistens]ENX34933.1 hypothetical protein F889_01573 [Acinetobacter colistiniresistens]